MLITKHIFREYDIRGLMDKEINFDFVHCLGLVLSKYFNKRGHSKILIGYDTRRNSFEYHNILAKKFNDFGFEVLSLGMIPSPCLYFAAYVLDIQCGIMVTASHNEAPYNGFKIWLDQRNLFGYEIQEIYTLMQKQEIESNGQEHLFTDYKKYEIYEDYLDRICSETPKLNFRVVLDGSNGVAGKLCSKLLQRLGVEVFELYCDPCENFPNHDPDPTVAENCRDLCDMVVEFEADCGIALDGDGDRVVFVDRNGRVLTSDETLSILAKDILRRKNGEKVLADVKCSQKLFDKIRSMGGQAIITPCGHSLLKNAMKKEEAILGGELSGHFFHAENWFGTDDGLLTAVRVLKILQTNNWDLVDFPTWEKAYVSPEIYYKCPENKKFLLVKKVKDFYSKKYEDAKLCLVDGIRVELENAWFLVRPSNTSAALSLRFESHTEEDMLLLKKEIISQIDEWNLELG